VKKLKGSEIFSDAAAYQELEARKSLFGMQLIFTAILCAVAAGVGVVEYFFPKFFDYPYFSWSVNSGDVFAFWPMYVWGIALTALISSRSSSSFDGKLLALGTLTSVMAGVWEEVAFRCFYICYAMVVVLVFNWLFSTGLGIFLTVLFAGGAVACLLAAGSPLVKVVGAGILGFLAWLAWGLTMDFDPLYWFYDTILIPIAYYATFKQAEPVLYGGYPALFVYGAFLANMWFRDGHKYQGLLGWVNSWYLGMVLLYAMLTYGLLTAIVVHALYDILIHVTIYVRRKFTR